MFPETFRWVKATLFLVSCAAATGVRAPHARAFGAGVAPTATVPFEENQGQFDPLVAFAARTFGGTVFVTHEGRIVYALSADGSVGAHGCTPLQPNSAVSYDSCPTCTDKLPGSWIPASAGMTDSPKQWGVALSETLVGAMSRGVRGGEQAVTRVSYFRGNDPTKWLSGLPTYQGVDLGEVYPGITLQLIAHNNNVEKRFIVAPGAQPEMIRIRVEGAQALQTNAVDELELTTELGPVGLTAPIAYQPVGEPTEAIHESPLRPVAPVGVAVVYDVSGDEYGFAVGRYDHSRPLVIDPLLASTFFGGTIGADKSYAIALNDPGAVYITGLVISPDFPMTEGAFQQESPGGYDAFVSKFSHDLRFLLASTHLGGSGDELGGVDIAVDSQGNVVVIGRTGSTDFPTTPGAVDEVSNVTPYTADGFVSKLSSDLTTLLASTYLGGTLDERPYAVLTDETGRVYVAGVTYGDFPTTVGSYNPTLNGPYDAFISRLNPDFTELEASTYFGGPGNDHCTGMVRDAIGNIYVAGCGAVPTTPGAFDTTINGGWDVYVAKFDGDLTTLRASTLLGGSQSECAGGYETNEDAVYSSPLALDVFGRVLVGGYTYSHDFPTTPGAFREVLATLSDSFVAVLAPDLSTLEAATYFDGVANAGDEVRNIFSDPWGDILVVGRGGALTYTTPGAYQQSGQDRESDVFATRFDPTLSVVRASTVFGGWELDAVFGALLDESGNVWMTGWTTSGWTFPTTPGAYQEETTLYHSLFISELSRDLAADPPCGHHGDVSFNGRVTVRDAQLAYGAALGGWVPLTWQQCAADCNSDGEVTFEDVQQIFAAALLQGQCSEAVPAAARSSESAGTVHTPKASDSNGR